MSFHTFPLSFFCFSYDGPLSDHELYLLDEGIHEPDFDETVPELGALSMKPMQGAHSSAYIQHCTSVCSGVKRSHHVSCLMFIISVII